MAFGKVRSVLLVFGLSGCALVSTPEGDSGAAASVADARSSAVADGTTQIDTFTPSPDRPVIYFSGSPLQSAAAPDTAATSQPPQQTPLAAESIAAAPLVPSPVVSTGLLPPLPDFDAAAEMPTPKPSAPASRLPPLPPELSDQPQPVGPSPQLDTTLDLPITLPPPSVPAGKIAPEPVPQTTTSWAYRPAPGVAASPPPTSWTSSPAVAVPKAAPATEWSYTKPAPAPSSLPPVSMTATPDRVGSAVVPAASPSFPPVSPEPAPVPALEPAALNTPSDEPLALGANDVLTVTVVGSPELTTDVYVSDDGSITVPLAGKVQVRGLSPTDAARRIAKAYVDGEFLVNPQVNVVRTKSLSQQITVLGEVQRPGRFTVETRLTVLDAIAQAGGISQVGSETVVVLREQGGVVSRYPVDLNAALRSGGGNPYFELRSGDTVMVPRAERFFIYGEVRSPNAYRLLPGTTVMQALSLGGGVTDRGSDRRMQIKRRGADGHVHTLSADLGDVVQADDVIYVKERIF